VTPTSPDAFRVNGPALNASISIQQKGRRSLELMSSDFKRKSGPWKRNSANIRKKKGFHRIRRILYDLEDLFTWARMTRRLDSWAPRAVLQ
jgi:hypothetical protein